MMQPAILDRHRMRVLLLTALTSLLAFRLHGSDCARAESKVFLPLIGNWSVDWTDRIAPGDYAHSKATAHIEQEPTGCTLVEYLAGKRNGRSFRAMTLISFAVAEELQQVLQDSEHGGFLLFTGSQEGDRTRFRWERATDGKRLMMQQDYFAITAKSFETEMRLSRDGGSTWNVVQAAKYRRR